MSIGADLIAFMAENEAITNIVGDKLHHARVPERDAVTGQPDVPYLWVNRRGTEDLRQNRGTRGQKPLAYLYDVDCVSADIAQAEDLVDAVRAHCQYFAGMMGATNVGQLYVSDQSEDYVSINQDADSGVFVMSCLVEIIPS